MPEAPIDVYRYLRTPEDDVRNAPHAGQGLLVHPESEPEGVQRRAERGQAGPHGAREIGDHDVAPAVECGRDQARDLLLVIRRARARGSLLTGR